MIHGVHVLLYSTNPEADRAFLRDVIGLRGVDIGHGWMIFALPPAEAAVHPADDKDLLRHGDRAQLGAVVYLMCTDLKAEMKALQAKGVEFSPVDQAGWGIKTTLRLPSGGELGLYQPLHPTAFAK
jgi:catechol 2,3-dioxygenase-like lactoylglutathione lyase family enzyme